MCRFGDKNALFLLILNKKTKILQEKEYVTFILLYLWAKYEPIWLDLLSKQCLVPSAYLLRYILWRM